MEINSVSIPERRGIKGFFFFLRFSSFWFGWNCVAVSITAVIWPSQIANIVGPEKKEMFIGIIPGSGLINTQITDSAAVLAMFVTIIAGSLSDRTKSRIGKRRPFILVRFVEMKITPSLEHFWLMYSLLHLLCLMPRLDLLDH